MSIKNLKTIQNNLWSKKTKWLILLKKTSQKNKYQEHGDYLPL